MNTRFRLAAAGLLFLAMVLLSPTAFGQAASAPLAGTARVELLLLDKGKNKLYLDGAAGALLSGPRSYVSLRVEPGWHLLWGTAKPEWFHFEAGRTYALIYSEAMEGWFLDDTLHARIFIQQRGLTEVAPTVADLAALGAGVMPEKYDKIRAKAGEPVVPRLPADFKALYRKSTSRMAAHFNVKKPGNVHLDANAISIEGGVTIPIAEIKMLQFYGSDETGTVGIVPWAAVLFKSVDSPTLALLGIAWNYNEFYRAVELARAGLAVRPDTTSESK